MSKLMVIRVIRALCVIYALLLIAQTKLTSAQSKYTRQPYYARSITELKALARFELEIGKNLTQSYLAKNTLDRDMKLKHLVERYLLDFYQSSGFAHFQDVLTSNDSHVFQNPVCTYRLIRRVKVFLRDLVFRPSFFRVFGDQWRRIFYFFWQKGWPNSKDMNDTTDAIHKIQEVYDFDVHQFARGQIGSFKTNCTLDSSSVYEIARTYYGGWDRASTIRWLEAAREIAMVDKKASVSIIELLLRKAVRKHNRVFDEESLMELYPTTFDRRIRGIPGDSKNATKARTLHYNAYKGIRTVTHADINNWALCSGDNFQTEEEKRHLFCWNEYKMHPTLEIGPAKMEFLARNPDVVQIYDILRKKETETFISLAAPRIQPSYVQRYDGVQSPQEKAESQESYSAKTRNSMVAWMGEEEDLDAARRIEYVTGLRVLNSSEPLQIASYVSGGVFKPHGDDLNRPGGRAGRGAGRGAGGRLATFMFYFNTVEMGGQTAFPHLGVAAQPVKGSALLWYNLYSDLDTDDLVLHGACPVVLGEKWAANKWILSHNQDLKQKCSLKKRERIRIPVNNLILPFPAIRKR